MKILSLILVAFSLSACGPTSMRSFATVEVTAPSLLPKQWGETIDFQGIPLRSGQIITSNSNTALNLIVTLTDTDHHPYAHAGIILIEQGKPYVYHAVARLRLLFNGSPTDITKGVIERWPLMEFLKNKMVVAIYDPPSPAIGKSMSEFAVRSRRERLAYDAVFDELDRSKVYCSEFIVSALEASGDRPVPVRPRSSHPSIDIIHEWLSIKAKGHYFVSDLVDDNRLVALLSERLTRQQIDVYIGLRAELFRRFTPDQKIGNMMSWTGFGVKLRPEIERFVQRGIDGEFRERGEGESQQDWIMALADEVFGPVAGG